MKQFPRQVTVLRSPLADELARVSVVEFKAAFIVRLCDIAVNGTWDLFIISFCKKKE